MTPPPGFPNLRIAEEAPAAPRQARSRARRVQLLEAGRRLFARKPYAAVTIQEITTAAGTAAGSFYQHFASKRQFLVALMNEFLQRLASLDLRPAGGGDIRNALSDLLMRAFRADTAYHGVIRAWQEAAAVDPELARLEGEIREWTDARVLGVFRLLQNRHGGRPGRDLPEFARMMNRHFWSLLARGPGAPPRERAREIQVAADVIFHYLFRDDGRGSARPQRQGSGGRGSEA